MKKAATSPEERHRADVEALTVTASKWMSRAARAWAASDLHLVAVAAPLAVEQLGKAYLWQTNPLLALPIGNSREALFVRVAQNPSLTEPALRTVGLGEVISRVQKMLDTWPLSDDAAKKLKDARDGAVHVGSPAAASPEELLRSAIVTCDRLLTAIATERGDFYQADDLELIDTLRKEYHSDVERRVQMRRAKAGHALEELRRATGDQFDDVVAAREALAADQLDGTLSNSGSRVGVTEECPVCGSKGRLYGRYDVDYEVDYDHEPLGGGQYDAIPYAYPVVTLDPLAFGCNVCHLRLDGADELIAGSIDPQQRPIDVDELGEDFDLNDLFPEPDEDLWRDR